MLLVLNRKDLREEFSDVDFDEVEFIHFKTSVQDVLRKCLVDNVFEETPYSKKEIVLPYDFGSLNFSTTDAPK